jgi:hypothetical protein
MPSTVIKDFEYDAASRRLMIRFRHGGVYEYSGVPPDTYEDLRHSRSKGRFFHERIRDRFRFRRASER